MKDENIILIKQKDISKNGFIDVGEGNKCAIDDTIGKNHGLPFTFGIGEIYPSKGIDFDYEADGATCICLEGVIKLEDCDTKQVNFFEVGDVIHISQKKDKHVIWSSEIYSKFAFVTYPHWR